MRINEITREVISCALRVHNQAGPGFCSDLYKECMTIEMDHAGLTFDKDKPLYIKYNGQLLKKSCLIDFLVGNKVLVIVKSADQLGELDKAQATNYLKISGCKAGLIINFNSQRLKDGIRRVVKNFNLNYD